jgi:hypothetical protein
MVRLVLKKTEGRFRVLFSIEDDIEAGLGQRQAKEFAFAWAVVDQEDGGVRHHKYIWENIAGIVPGEDAERQKS